jgi:hypothetical protein
VTNSANEASGTLFSAWHGLSEAVRLTIRHRLTALQILRKTEHLWPMTGSVWLGIAGLLLGGLVLAA